MPALHCLEPTIVQPVPATLDEHRSRLDGFAAQKVAPAEVRHGWPTRQDLGVQTTHPVLALIRTCAAITHCRLTPKLSRAAAGREAHGTLYLPCGLRPDAVSA